MVLKRYDFSFRNLLNGKYLYREFECRGKGEGGNCGNRSL